MYLLVWTVPAISSYLLIENTIYIIHSHCLNFRSGSLKLDYISEKEEWIVQFQRQQNAISPFQFREVDPFTFPTWSAPPLGFLTFRLLFFLNFRLAHYLSSLPSLSSFPSNLFLFLQNLEAELSEDFSHLDISYGLFLSTTTVFLGSPLIYDDCLCRVDDLKIFTEDQLMDMALKEVFKVLYTCTSLCCFFLFHCWSSLGFTPWH